MTECSLTKTKSDLSMLHSTIELPSVSVRVSVSYCVGITLKHYIRYSTLTFAWWCHTNRFAMLSRTESVSDAITSAIPEPPAHPVGEIIVPVDHPAIA